MIDTTITLGNIIEVSAFVFAGAVMVIKTNDAQKYMKMELLNIQKEINKIGEILITLATTNVRLTNLESDVRDLRHGHGFIQRGVNGEYAMSGKIDPSI